MCSRRGSQAREGAAYWLQEPLPSHLAPAEPGPSQELQLLDGPRKLRGRGCCQGCPRLPPSAHLGVPPSAHPGPRSPTWIWTPPPLPSPHNAAITGGLSSALISQRSRGLADPVQGSGGQGERETEAVRQGGLTRSGEGAGTDWLGIPCRRGRRGSGLGLGLHRELKKHHSQYEQNNLLVTVH